jgi:hypothetical protein
MKNHSFVQFLFTYRTIFMKAYIFLLSLGLFASTQFIKAQGSSYSIFPGTVDMSWDYTEDLDMKAYISSNSMLNQDIEYTVTALDIPQQWQDLIITQFCDVQSCYDFRWFKLGDKKEMKLFANQKNGILKVDFLLPMDTVVTIQPGSAEIALAFNRKGETEQDTLRFMVNKSATGIKELNEQSGCNIVQMPNETVQISNSIGISEIKIYDITGTMREVHHCGDAQLAVISMREFTSGLYLLRIKGKDGKEYSATIIQ